MLDLPEYSSTRDDLDRAMTGHVLGHGQLMGTYEKEGREEGRKEAMNLGFSGYGPMRSSCTSRIASECTGPAAASLRTEGWAMLAALLEDFVRVAGTEVETLLGVAAADKTPPPAVVVHRVDHAEEATVFRRLAAAADWTLVVAPEIDDVLPGRLEGSRQSAAAPSAQRRTRRGWPATSCTWPTVCANTMCRRRRPSCGLTLRRLSRP